MKQSPSLRLCILSLTNHHDPFSSQLHDLDPDRGEAVLENWGQQTSLGSRSQSQSCFQHHTLPHHKFIFTQYKNQTWQCSHSSIMVIIQCVQLHHKQPLTNSILYQHTSAGLSTVGSTVHLILSQNQYVCLKVYEIMGFSCHPLSTDRAHLSKNKLENYQTYL